MLVSAAPAFLRNGSDKEGDDFRKVIISEEEEGSSWGSTINPQKRANPTRLISCSIEEQYRVIYSGCWQGDRHLYFELMKSY